jgi:hypothetical protein
MTRQQTEQIFFIIFALHKPKLHFWLRPEIRFLFVFGFFLIHYIHILANADYDECYVIIEWHKWSIINHQEVSN